MSFWDDDIEFIDWYEEPGQNVIDQAVVNNSQTLVPSGGEQLSVQPTAGTAVTEYTIGEKYRSAFSAAQSPQEFDAQVEIFKEELNAEQLTQPKFGAAESETPSTGSALFNSIMSGNFSGNPDTTKSFVDKVQYNFETNKGPTSIADVPSVLTEWEIENGFYLAPDEFGIDRKFKNGMMVPEDADKVSILRNAFEKAVHDAFTKLVGSSSNVSPQIVNNSSKDVKTDSSYGPTLSDAIKQGLVLDSSGRIVTGNGDTNVSDLVYRGNGQAQFTHWEGVRGQNLANPNGQWTLIFSSEGNYGDVILYDENKKVIFSCDATSGRIGETDRSKEYEGPIRFGSYTLDPKDISGGIEKAIQRNIILREDWGLYRVPLKPQEGTIMGTRGEFFLHGGFFPGSAGCIDIGTNDRVLFPLLMQHEGLINVEVIQRKRYDILFPNGRQNFNT